MNTTMTMQDSTACAHPPVPAVEVNADRWLDRMSFHLELALRHLRDEPELATPMHRAVAREMVDACLTDYRTLRAQQAEAARLADLPCRPCLIGTVA
jgi:hypothetical protein